MSKKQLKKRIKELEAENLMLRTMAAISYPVYIYLYRDIPYNPYWQPYRLPTPGWYVDYANPQVTWISGGTSDVTTAHTPWIASGVSVADGSSVSCNDWAL